MMNEKSKLNITNERNHTIDFLKGLAIILIVITHFEWTSKEIRNFTFPYIINMAVPIFMIITGYVYSMSYDKKNVEHLEDAYSLRLIVPKIIRYTLPFLFIVIWEIIDPRIPMHFNKKLDALQWFLDGTVGKGSYYYPIMIQLVFVFPLIYFVIKKKMSGGGTFALLST